MPAQKITGFLGLLPRTAERLLPEMAAQTAENVILTSGEIRPMRPPIQTHIPLSAGEKYSAYRADNGTIEKWATWAFDVDVCKAPLSPDVEARYYWTGDGCPRYVPFTGFGYRSASYVGVYGAVTTCTCPDVHGLVTGNQVIINGVTLTVTVTTAYVFTVPGNYSAYTSYRHVEYSYALGFPNPASKPSASHSGGTGAAVSRSYCYTYYQPATGEESGPSPASDLATGKVDGTWTITTFSGTPTNDRAANYNTGGLYQRLYRTEGTTGVWQLVAERAVSTGNWTDTALASAIPGDDLVSADYEPPPVGLLGLITLPNGSTVGFYNNQLCYSEPYQPHAYPLAYRFETESPIIGIAAYGTTVVVCTKTRPYVAGGVTPDVVTMEAVNNIWPCKSKRSVCSAGDGVVFATEAGLAYVGMSNVQIITKSLYTIEEWRTLQPATMDVKIIDNRIFILYLPEGGSTNQMLRIDMGEQAQLVAFTADCNALYSDTLNSYLYFISDVVDRFDGYFGQRETYAWHSKEFEFGQPVNLGCGMIDWSGTMSTSEVQAAYSQYVADQAAAQAVIDAGIAVGAFGQVGFNTDPINGSSGIAEPRQPAELLDYTLYANAVPIATVRVLPNTLFRLPAGYKAEVFSHQLIGNVRVKSIKIATTPQELAGV